jgi:circadian clock protein KaiC
MTNENDAPQIERLTTGVERLDEVLYGGIPQYSVVFVAGQPGTGKTILSEQMLFANAAQGRTGLYLSTVSEPAIKVLRFLQGFSFFDQKLFGQKVIYGDLGTPLRQGGPAAMIQHIDELIRANRPQLIVIDSFKAIRDIIRDPLAFREFTSDLAIRLSTWEVTSLLVGEYSAEDIREGPEFAIADGVLFMYGTEEAQKQKRFIRVMKMRGTPYREGEHFFDISSDGIIVYPRMLAQAVGEYEFPGGRVGSVIEGANELLGGGPFIATSTLVSGATGAGKTLFALSFLISEARLGRPALMVSFEEGANQIIREADSFEWDVQALIDRGVFDILHVSPSDLDVDRHSYIIKKRADDLKAKAVMIDSITAFDAAVPYPSKYKNYLWPINYYFKRQGVSVFMTTESKDPFGPLEISTRAISFVSDNIVFLRYVETGSQIQRAIGVLKMRGSGHDRHIRAFIIEPPRIAIGAPLELAGVLGSTVR